MENIERKFRYNAGDAVLVTRDGVIDQPMTCMGSFEDEDGFVYCQVLEGNVADPTYHTVPAYNVRKDNKHNRNWTRPAYRQPRFTLNLKVA